MRSGLRILITNNALDGRGGTEAYIGDLARALLRRGHLPVVYSARLGAAAADLRRGTVPVIDDLSALNEAPDLIHAQHHLDAMVALLRFPAAPAILMCHGWQPWEERPPVFPSIRYYVAVDDLCRERLITTPGVPPDRVRTIYNGVDLSRFLPRPPLPPRPRSALVFSNYAHESTFVAAIREACRSRDIERVDILGRGGGTETSAPETVLGDYDLVFAKARAALEAAATGCFVVVADFAGLGGAVTPENVAALRRLNFGVRTMQAAPLTVAGLASAIDQYDAEKSQRVSAWVREHASAEQAFSELEALYAETLASGSPWSVDSAPEFTRAASAYLASLGEAVKKLDDTNRKADLAAADARERLVERDGIRAERDALAGALEQIHRSKAWRAVDSYRRLRKRLSI